MSQFPAGAPKLPRHKDIGRLLPNCPDRRGVIAAVSTFLTRSGANITRSQAADRAVVHLVLSPPVIHAESILHDL